MTLPSWMMGMGGFIEDPLHRKYSLVIGEIFPGLVDSQGYVGRASVVRAVGRIEGVSGERVMGQEARGALCGRRTSFFKRAVLMKHETRIRTTIPKIRFIGCPS